jgi:hypothetical protein
VKIQTSAVPIGIDRAAGQGGGLFVGRVVDVTPGRPPEERQQRDVIIPAGQGRFGKVHLKPGEYIVEALMPGGELLDQRVSVSESGASAPILLRRRGPLGTDLGWQIASGNVHQSSLKSELPSVIREILQPSPAAAPSQMRYLIGLGLLFLFGSISSWLWPESERSAPRPAPIEMEASNASGVIAEDMAKMSAEATASDGASADGNASAYSPTAVRRMGKAPAMTGRIKAQAGQPSQVGGGSGPMPKLKQTWFGLPKLWVGLGIATIFALVGGVWFFLRRAREPKYSTLARRRTEAPPSAAAPPMPQASTPATEAILFRLPAAMAWTLIEATEKGPEAVNKLIDPLPAKAVLQPRAGEGFQFYDIAPDAPLVTHGVDPLYAFVPSAGSPGEIVVVPMPWRLGEGGEAAFEIAASDNAASSFSTGSAIQDPSISTIAGYMSTGRLREAELLVRSASHLLNHKYHNAMAAAIGAYVLLATCQGSTSGQNWRPWIENLYRDFPALADGAILQGWTLLQTQTNDADLQAALDCFLEAPARGIPIYAEGVRMLQSGLAMFAKRAESDERVRSAIAKADLLATRCNPSQAFTTIRISRQS